MEAAVSPCSPDLDAYYATSCCFFLVADFPCLVSLDGNDLCLGHEFAGRGPGGG
ncbi:Unknown protein sequence [Pseudomonas syringae pv. cilantro]|uniref:Uncharacterized protein n=1 Tax=Pseudomonas syringae pv. cilantro TaxID=81035 RepID=A0A0N0GD60_PSESX|nr:Unknown protein sequence [Pseudomonas syringae pv. cilantro]